VKKLKNDVRKLHRQTIKWHNDKFDKLTGIKKVNGKLKLFTPEADITYKMKKIVSVIKKVTLHLNILSLLIFFACGSDNPVNNGNPPPTPSNDSLVKIVDSLALYTNGLNTNDTILYGLFNADDSIKISLTVETNCTTSDTAFVGIFVGNISVNLTNSDFPNTFTFYGLYPTSTSGIAINLYLKTTILRYIRAKNIRLYKVNPV